MGNYSGMAKEWGHARWESLGQVPEMRNFINCKRKWIKKKTTSTTKVKTKFKELGKLGGTIFKLIEDLLLT